MRKHKDNNLQLVRKRARIYLFADILCFFKHFCQHARSYEDWGISLGDIPQCEVLYIQSRDAFRLMASTYFFPRQDHPITGRTSQTRLECFVSQGLKLTRLVRTSLTLEILALNCKLNTEESTGFPLTIMHIQGSLRIQCLFLILLQKRMPHSY